MLVQALQLVLRPEIYLNPAAFALPADAHARAERHAQLLFRGARVHVGTAGWPA